MRVRASTSEATVLRTFGDVVFIVGAVAMAWQVVIGLMGRGATSPAEPLLQPAR